MSCYCVLEMLTLNKGQIAMEHSKCHNVLAKSDNSLPYFVYCHEFDEYMSKFKTMHKIGQMKENEDIISTPSYDRSVISPMYHLWSYIIAARLTGSGIKLLALILLSNLLVCYSLQYQ